MLSSRSSHGALSKTNIAVLKIFYLFMSRGSPASTIDTQCSLTESHFTSETLLKSSTRELKNRRSITSHSSFTDKAEGDEDEEMDYTTSQLYNDVDIRLNELVDSDKGFVQEEGTDATMTNVQQGNENPKIVQVIEDAHVTLSTVPQKTEVLIFPHTDAEIVSLMDVHVHHEVPSQQTPTLFTIPISVISDSSPVFSTVIPQSLPSFTPPTKQSTSTPPTTEATNPLSTLLDFASVFQLNNIVTTLEKEIAELKKDPMYTQVTALVDDHLDARLGVTRDEFMSFLSTSLTSRITEQVQNQLPQILPEESSQPQSLYEAAATLTKFKLKKILIDKIDKSESYLAAPEHRKCYEGLKKSYDLDKTILSTYGRVYSLKRNRKDKDEDPSTGSHRGLKKRKTSKDAAPATGPKSKESQSGSSKGDKSQSKSSRKSVQSEEPEFKVRDSDMPQDQEENLEPTDPDWNVGKTSQQGQNQSWLMTLASSAEKPSKTFDELMSRLAFRLLKGTRSNYVELEYDFEECYKALSEKLDWENPEGGDYPFDLTKPISLVMSRNPQKVLVDYFFNNNLKYLQGGISTMTYTTSLTKTKAAQYDLVGIEDMVPNIWVPIKFIYDLHALCGISHWREQRKTFYAYARGLQSRHDVYSTKRILAVTRVEVMRKHGYGYLKEIVVRRVDNILYRFKEGGFPRLRINDIKDMLLIVVQNRLINLLGGDVSDFAIALRMFTRSLVI
ncbi:hypothetical protein Tco_0228386 [Tanacetum coccineum]